VPSRRKKGWELVAILANNIAYLKRKQPAGGGIDGYLVEVGRSAAHAPPTTAIKANTPTHSN
jgi:hypothetical protein